MQISENQVGSVLVLQIRGKILMGEGNVAIKKKIQEKVNAGSKEIVLDLADVPYIDSSGLGELISSYTTVQKAGGRLKLANLTNKIVDLLAITKLVTVFEYYGSVEEAVASFK
jgi:anti-sigma B factor antagonist